MIKAILACDENWGIGKEGGLPWPHNSADLRWFKKLNRYFKSTKEKDSK